MVIVASSSMRANSSLRSSTISSEILGERSDGLWPKEVVGRTGEASREWTELAQDDSGENSRNGIVAAWTLELLLTKVGRLIEISRCRPRLTGRSFAEDDDLTPNKFLIDHGDLAGDVDLDPLLRPSSPAEVLRRGSDCGVGGAGLGVRNLSAGFMVFRSAGAPTDALRFLVVVFSIGTKRRLTGCPGIYGQAVVEGSLLLCTSVPSSISYCDNELASLQRILRSIQCLHSSSMFRPSLVHRCAWSVLRMHHLHHR